MLRGDSLPPKLLQAVGIGIGIVFLVVWVATGRAPNELLLGFATMLVGGGLYGQGRALLKDKDKERGE
jgi:xanthosine utilization system XapX-like protein